MPYLDTAQQWLKQSSLLLKARPETTRITSKYTISSKPTTSETTATTQLPQPTARATLILKTYDPVSGTTLKYSTNKGAEVSRLIQILGRLARGMAGLEERDEVEEIKEEVMEKDVVGKTVQGGAQQGQAGGQQQQQGTKGKGKKKGKK